MWGNGGSEGGVGGFPEVSLNIGLTMTGQGSQMKTTAASGHTHTHTPHTVLLVSDTVIDKVMCNLM